MTPRQSSLLFSLIFFTICFVGLDRPGTLIFDELHYIPAAKQFAELGKNTNWEHPTLGKIWIAAGIKLFGDNPYGWRFFSLIAGALLIFFMTQSAYLLSRNRRTLVYAGILTLCSGVFYVHSRIGLLEIFLWAALSGALYFYLRWIVLQEKKALYWAGACIGSAAATKWSGLYLMPAILFYELIQFATHRSGHSLKNFFLLIRHMTLLSGIVVVVYFFFQFFLIFLHVDQHSLWSVIKWQLSMWRGQLEVGQKTHTYASRWETWFLMSRPIWYYYEVKEFAQGILLIGNPIIFWTMPAMLILTLKDTVLLLLSRKKLSSEQSALLFLIVAYLVMYLIWSVAPRSMTFYYYYMPPVLAALLLFSHFMGTNKNRRAMEIFAALSIAGFLYFLPIYSAMSFPPKMLNWWAWLRSWI